MKTTYSDGQIRVAIENFDYVLGSETIIEIGKGKEKIVFFGDDIIPLLNCLSQLTNSIEEKAEALEKINGGSHE